MPEPVDVSFHSPPIILGGGITKANVVEIGGANPVNIIRTDQSWEVHVEWYLKGWIMCSPFWTFLGEWTIALCLESLGVEPEYKFVTTVPVTDFVPAPGPDCQRDYQAVITLNPGNVVPGLYKAVVVITYAAGGVPGPIAGFRVAEPALMQIYQSV